MSKNPMYKLSRKLRDEKKFWGRGSSVLWLTAAIAGGFYAELRNRTTLSLKMLIQSDYSSIIDHLSHCSELLEIRVRKEKRYDPDLGIYEVIDKMVELIIKQFEKDGYFYLSPEMLDEAVAASRFDASSIRKAERGQRHDREKKKGKTQLSGKKASSRATPLPERPQPA